MSSEILDALTNLFGLITKQDGGATEVERGFVINYFSKELDDESAQKYAALYDDVSEYGKPQPDGPMPMKESVRVLRYCREINKNLEQSQKVIILVKLLELIASDQNFAPGRREVIDTVSSVFHFKGDYSVIEGFVLSEDAATLDYPNILVAAANSSLIGAEAKFMEVPRLNGQLIFLHIKSVDIYFVKYIGTDDVRLNGFAIENNQVHLLPGGSNITIASGKTIYYGDVTSIFLESLQSSKLSFTAESIKYEFPNGAIGIQPTSISETQGKLLGIMGGSGAGKTTLMNVLAGIEEPSEGRVLINGIDIHKDKKNIEGVIGYIAQDDLLIEELTVYQNLYYNAKLCFKDLSEKEIDERVMTTLTNLGLDHIRDLKVGSVLNKKISGGQRKRLNIALELIREPAVMFVDEPTSGLSSKDSQNVIDLLKDLSIKGKLIFVVIHQPSAEIYKSFDKMIILDKGGYLIFYGNPIEAIRYFKKQTNQADSGRWSDNPEEMFNLIEKEVVNEFGQSTGRRQNTPENWYAKYNTNFEYSPVEEIKEKPPSSLNLPNIIKQTYIFTVRDMLAKISNTQYMLINLLEAPVLALLLSFVIRFQNDPQNGEYVFRYNDNIPAYVLICIIIALFMGLTVSAEEIIKDRKIQKREAFLNLSRFAYLNSKIIILFVLSAIQTLSFVVIGNTVLEIQGELFSYWGILFAISCFANVIGLNISATFNSVITIYITIPLLLIPQMILSGIIFRYEKMNNVISEKGTVPIIADVMVSRWAFEAIIVDNFVNNKYEQDYYDLEKIERENEYKIINWLPTLKIKLNKTLEHQQKEKKNDSIKSLIKDDLALIRKEVKTENAYMGILKDEKIKLDRDLTPKNFDMKIADKMSRYFDTLTVRFQDIANDASKDRETLVNAIKEKRDSTYDDTEYKNKYHNDGIANFVTSAENKLKEPIVEQNGRLLQMIDQIYNEPSTNTSFLNYRTHFCAPKKHFGGKLYPTYYFNMVVIWLFTFLFYITLYFNVFKKLLDLFSK